MVELSSIDNDSKQQVEATSERQLEPSRRVLRSITNVGVYAFIELLGESSIPWRRRYESARSFAPSPVWVEGQTFELRQTVNESFSWQTDLLPTLEQQQAQFTKRRTKLQELFKYPEQLPAIAAQFLKFDPASIKEVGHFAGIPVVVLRGHDELPSKSGNPDALAICKNTQLGPFIAAPSENLQQELLEHEYTHALQMMMPMQTKMLTRGGQTVEVSRIPDDSNIIGIWAELGSYSSLVGVEQGKNWGDFVGWFDGVIKREYPQFLLQEKHRRYFDRLIVALPPFESYLRGVMLECGLDVRSQSQRDLLRRSLLAALPISEAAVPTLRAIPKTETYRAGEAWRKEYEPTLL